MAKASADHVDLMFPNRYLKAADMKGREVEMTIDSVVMETLKRSDGSEDLKPVVYFVETKDRKDADRKVLVLGKTTAAQIASLHGKGTGGWTGKKVTLYSAKVKAFGETVDAVRVKVPSKKRGR